MKTILEPAREIPVTHEADLVVAGGGTAGVACAVCAARAGLKVVMIEQTAQAILNARALYPDSSLADLYDELTMPPELRTAHQQNDRAVMEAYGMPVKGTTESSCVAELMRRYQELTAR